jgi:hypothetical protein
VCCFARFLAGNDDAETGLPGVQSGLSPTCTQGQKAAHLCARADQAGFDLLSVVTNLQQILLRSQRQPRVRPPKAEEMPPESQ